MGKIVGIFPIGDTGEEFGVAEWVPDPEVIANQLFKLANDLEDWTEPLTEAKEAFIYSTELHFETQSDPYGHEWTALDEQYRKNKLAAGWPDKILERTGDLHKAATSQDAWQITEREIIFNSEVIPFYGGVHQAGTASEEVSNVLHKLRTGQDLTREDVGVVTGGTGRGNNLPQRQFVGADEDTIAEVEEIFVRWINSLTVTDLPLFGGGFAVRGPHGRFVKSGRGKV